MIPSPPKGERARVRGPFTQSHCIHPLTPTLSPCGGEGEEIMYAL
jgi:hypothetical protein